MATKNAFKSETEFGQLTGEEWSYFAGLIDADGCVTINKSSRSKRGLGVYLHASVTLVNTDHGIIGWVKEKIGGNPAVINRTRLAQGKEKNPVYQFTWRNRRAEPLLRRIEDRLTGRKGVRANLVLQFMKTVCKDKDKRAGLKPDTLAERDRLYALMRQTYK